MKHKKASIKWKIFFYLFSFTLILLVILWLFQIVYLDSFYKVIKKSKLESATDYLVDNIDSDDLESLVSELATENDVSIRIADINGNDLVQSDFMRNSSITNISDSIFESYYNETVANGGEWQRSFYLNSDRSLPSIGNDISNQNDTPNDSSQTEGDMESIIELRICEIDGAEYLIMVNSVITPISATVETLRVQLLCISGILFLLSLLIALLMSKKISKSIIKVNASAKELAQGNYDVAFEGNDYREIAELSDTLNYTSRELSRTEALQKELIANVSHDLRTPLTMIIAYSEGMRDLPGENTPENVQVVIDEAKRLTNLVNDMLDVSKLQSGVMETKMEVYNLTKSIEAVMERYTKLKEQDGYNISFEYDREVYIKADEFKIFQVIYNMVNNAINYTGEDKVVTVRQIVKGDKVRIAVEDTGIGINGEDIDNVWERYYKVGKEHKRAIQGTGLGLSISKNILELHNAQYGVESIENKGSIFWFQLDIFHK